MGREQGEDREPVLVSACLLGRACRYDGRSSLDPALKAELDEGRLEPVPFCPEEHGGLPTPRPAAWIEKKNAAAVVDGQARVMDENGRDATDAFLAGARGALDRCRERGIRRAFLKERSPSCGVQCTHVDGEAVKGPGTTTELLTRAGIEVHGVDGGTSSGRKPDRR